MLALITRTSQPSSQEEACEKKVPSCILQEIAKITPIIVINEGIISLKTEDLEEVFEKIKKSGFFLRAIDDSHTTFK